MEYFCSYANSDFSAQLLLLCGDKETSPGSINNEGKQHILKAIYRVTSEIIKYLRTEITSTNFK